MDGYDRDNGTSSTTVVSLLLSNTSDSSWNTDVMKPMVGIGARIRQEWCDKWRYTDDDDLHQVYLRQIGQKWGRQGWDLVGGEIQRAESRKTLLEGAARKRNISIIVKIASSSYGEVLNSFRSFWKQMHQHIIDLHVICKDIKREQKNVVILILWHIKI